MPRSWVIADLIPKMLSAKQGANGSHFKVFGMSPLGFDPMIPVTEQTLYHLATELYVLSYMKFLFSIFADFYCLC